MKLKVGKEYWVLQQFATLERIEGTGQFATAICRNRWDQQFEVDVGMVHEKPALPKPKKKR